MNKKKFLIIIAAALSFAVAVGVLFCKKGSAGTGDNDITTAAELSKDAEDLDKVAEILSQNIDSKTEEKDGYSINPDDNVDYVIAESDSITDSPASAITPAQSLIVISEPEPEITPIPAATSTPVPTSTPDEIVEDDPPEQELPIDYD